MPQQTDASCRDTVTQALELRPERFAVFGYAHVPGFKLHQRKIIGADLPDGTERHRQAEGIANLLESAGYVRIGLDHYALPDDELAVAAQAGNLHRNFQGYTTDACQTLIGLGASSIGRLPQGYVQNATLIGDYQKRIAATGNAVAKGYAFQGEDRLRAAVIERIMCDYRVDLAQLCGQHRHPPIEVDLEQLAADGLVRRQGCIVEVPEAARPLVRVVAAAFDQYLGGGGGQHSRAI
ncbi:hypothetical protein [Sphingobium xenophagum]|uniref:hypothetical protein n=1 Tax=Sphingobium xenophagum TaxID=121428 RepID=UPI0036D2C7A1